MIRGGYYIKARSIQESEISSAPPHVREIWDWIIKEANFDDYKSHGINVLRGQLLTSYKEIIEGLSWFVGWRKNSYSKSQCEIAMKWLKKRGMITTMKTTRGMIITVCNYDVYQDPKNYENDTEKTTKTTDSRQSDDTIIKEPNKDKEVKELISSYSEDIISCYEYLVKLFPNDSKPQNDKEKLKWLEDIRKCHKIDKIALKELYNVVKWAREDDFWKSEFLSLRKIRRKKDGVSYLTRFKEKFKNAKNGKTNTGNSGSSRHDDRIGSYQNY